MNPKISHKEHFLPTLLTDLLIKETEMRPINIEEEKSELYYKTLNGYGEIKFKNNTEYQGHVKYGILDSEMGKCRIKFPNGTEYSGEIKQNFGGKLNLGYETHGFRIYGSGGYVASTFDYQEQSRV